MPSPPTDPAPRSTEDPAAPTTARPKHGCAACGAQAEWSPAKQALICPFCGTEAPAELDRTTGQVREIDLARTLRELPDERRGWLADRRAVRCRSCRAVSVLEAARVGQNCEFCGSPALVDYAEIKAPLRPESLLPFRVDRGAVRERVRAWIGSRWLAPGPFKRRALLETPHGIYLPYWTFDARARCSWTAEAGHTYYTSETYRDSRGRVGTRRVRHVRWVPAAGEIEHVFDDQPVAGSRGVDRALLARIEPFPTADAVAYDTAYLSGFVVEHYQVVLIDAARGAREAMHARLLELCAAEVPGDTSRNLQIRPEYSAETFKLLLVPVWLLSYRYGRKAYQVLVNGCTGAVGGSYPRSAWKLLLLVLAGAALAAALVWALR
jgi:hypothetical protein